MGASQRRYKEARKALDACLAEHSDDPSQCDEERATAIAAGERYEVDAQRAWGCERTPDQCYPGPGRTPGD